MPVGVYLDGNLLSAGNAIGGLDIATSNTVDIIFPPIKPPDDGLGLFKAVKIRVSSNASSSPSMTLSVYAKGNMPKDTGDNPTYSVTRNVSNGDNIFNLPHIVTEELIIRLRFTVNNNYNTNLSGELGNAVIKRNSAPKVRILQMWVDIEKYGDKGNINEGGWTV